MAFWWFVKVVTEEGPRSLLKRFLQWEVLRLKCLPFKFTKSITKFIVCFISDQKFRSYMNSKTVLGFGLSQFFSGCRIIETVRFFTQRLFSPRSLRTSLIVSESAVVLLLFREPTAASFFLVLAAFFLVFAAFFFFVTFFVFSATFLVSLTWFTIAVQKIATAFWISWRTACAALLRLVRFTEILAIVVVRCFACEWLERQWLVIPVGSFVIDSGITEWKTIFEFINSRLCLKRYFAPPEPSLPPGSSAFSQLSAWLRSSSSSPSPSPASFSLSLLADELLLLLSLSWKKRRNLNRNLIKSLESDCRCVSGSFDAIFTEQSGRCCLSVYSLLKLRPQ